MAQARDLLNMTTTQTPLLGDENTPLRAPTSGYDGATPRHQVAFTPNPLATPLHRRDGDPSATPRTDVGGAYGATPLRTPMRDNLSINEGGMSTVGDTPREQRNREKAMKNSLKNRFAALPQPKNEFEVVMPEDEDDEAAQDGVLSVEDAAERDARIKRQRDEAHKRELARRSLVVQRGLPRPVNVDVEKLIEHFATVPEAEPELMAARRLVDSELAHLIEHDTIAHPLPGTIYPGSTISPYDHPDDEAVATAKEIVNSELAAALGFPGANQDQVRQGLILLAGDEEVDPESIGWAAIRRHLAYDTASKTWVEPSSLSPEERIRGMAAMLQEDRDTMAGEASKSSKIEKKLGVTLGGYMKRSEVLQKRLVTAFEEMDKASIDLESFSSLSITETAAAPSRVQGLSEEVERLERRERGLQERYQDLDNQRRELKARITAREEQIMAEAEAINEEAMAAMEAAAEA